jgi:class 3 adenylate cyclase
MSTELREDPRRLRALLDLRELVDDLVEEAQRDRSSLVDALGRILPEVARAVGAEGVWVHTYDEDLALRTFSHGREPPANAGLVERCGPQTRARWAEQREGLVLVAQPIDVAGEWFGAAGFVLRSSDELEHLQDCLDMFSDVIDDFLFDIRAAREKQRVMIALAEALRAPVLSDGLRRAVAALAQDIPIAKLLIAMSTDDSGPAQREFHVQLYEGSEPRIDTLAEDAALRADVDVARIQREAADYVSKGDKALPRRFGFECGHLEEVLISPTSTSEPLGKILVASRRGSFNTHDRELFEDFAAFILQRIIDFNKDWRALAHSFRGADVARLLCVPDYSVRYLRPREQVAAILFADLSGFTRMSEKILVDPARIGALIDIWGREVVSIAFGQRGVFDKMVGDCLIAFFGPPFYEQSEADRVASAIRAARAIREATRTLPEREPALAALKGELGVAIGINFAPLFIGCVGPNEEFTGFSSGMNNTARLQSCAHRDEIFVMESAVRALGAGHDFAFSEEKNAAVKNVAEPLRFRALL